MAKRATRPNPPADSFGYWVFRLNRAMYAAFSARLAALGVTPPEWTVLAQARNEGMTPVVLAERMQIDRAAVTRLLDQLEQKRLVRRTPHPTDRRSTVVELTGDGLKLLPKLVSASAETNREFLRLLPPEDAQTLAALLRQLGERLPQQSFPLET